MGKQGRRVRKIAKHIAQSLKEIPSNVAIRAGVEVECIPLPILRFFAEVHLFHKATMHVRKRKENASRKKKS